MKLKKYVTIAFILCTIAAMVTGCYSEKIALSQTAKAHDRYPIEFMEMVMGWYPVHDSVTKHTEYLPGIPYAVPAPTNYVSVNCDSAKKAKEAKGDYSPVILNVDCPPNMIRVDTFKQVTETLRKNTIEIEFWKAKYLAEMGQHLKDNADKDAQISQLNKTKKTLWIAVISMTALIILYGVVKRYTK